MNELGCTGNDAAATPEGLFLNMNCGSWCYIYTLVAIMNWCNKYDRKGSHILRHPCQRAVCPNTMIQSKLLGEKLLAAHSTAHDHTNGSNHT